MATPGAPTAVAATPSTGVSANSGGRPSGRTPVHQISASLPSLFRTAPQQSNRRRSHQVPAAAASSPLAAADRRDAMNLVSTQCQTEDVLPHNVRAENARNAHDVSQDRRDSLLRPLSQYSESGVSAIVDDSSPLQPQQQQPAGPTRRRRREKRRHRRSSSQQGNVATQPLQQHVQQALQQQCSAQTELNTNVGSADMAPISPANSDHLPDILNSHMPPPYSTLPHNSERCMGMGPMPVPVPVGPCMAVPLGVGGLLTPLVSASPAINVAAAATGNAVIPNTAISLPPAGGRRSRGSMYAGEESGKSCCGVVVTQTVSIRWFIVMIAFVGICCAVVGTVLGAMRTSGREHLTVSLLMIGVGIVLITVSGIAWRLTSQDAPSCRAMLGLGPLLSATPISDQSGECGGTGVGTEPSRRFLTRIPPTYGRPHHPYAAMMYPEFQYRPPPPSYQASMQEYRLRLLLLDRDRHNQQQQQPQQSQSAAPSRPSCTVAPLQPPPPVSPPPTYRSQASTLRPPLPNREHEVSRPPSYRSRSSASSSNNVVDSGAVTSAPRGITSALECVPVAGLNPQSSCRAYHHHHQGADEATSSTQALIHVVDSKSIHPHLQLKNVPHAVLSHADEPPTCKRMDKDNNTVTIVQTTNSSQVLGREASPVLVTVTAPHSSSTSSASSSPVNTQNLTVLAQL